MVVEEETQVYLGLGGNFPDSWAVMEKALHLLSQSEGVRSLDVSSFHRTKAVGPIPQADFTNAVCRIYYTHSPYCLLKLCAQIERKLGQGQKAKFAPRLLDIDILFFGERWIRELSLEIPHPRWQERAFVLEPLSELTDEIRVPISATETRSFLTQVLI